MIGGDKIAFLFEKVLFVIFFLLFISSFILGIKELLLGAIIFFFFIPFIEQGLVLYMKFYYKGTIKVNIALAEEEGAFEKAELIVKKIVRFKNLPSTLEKQYDDYIKNNYTQLVETDPYYKLKVFIEEQEPEMKELPDKSNDNEGNQDKKEYELEDIPMEEENIE